MSDQLYEIGNALAGAAIGVATLQALFDKGILSLEESRTILDRSMRSLGTIQSKEGQQAQQFIASLLRGHYSARK